MEEDLPPFLDIYPDLPGLAVALGLGLLIGIQRGWTQRERGSGERIAGIRTFALTGLLGGLSLVLSRTLGDWLVAVMLVCLALLVVMGYRMRAEKDRNLSITSSVSLLLTFMFGALAAEGQTALAVGAAVVTALLLDNKQEIHRLLGRMRQNELDAGLKLLLISVVTLPILTDRGFGPGGALNPYEIWWMVVLIASISFVGYFAMRIGGARKGILFTSLFAGLGSSTALSLHYARLSRKAEAISPLLAIGILIACGTMFPRVLLITAVLHPPLAIMLAPPLLAAVAVLYLLAWWLWRRHSDIEIAADVSLNLQSNPLDLKAALLLGLVLAVILALAEIMRSGLGEVGIYLLAAVTGLADVNPITLSSAQMADKGLALKVAALSILIACGANSIAKAAMAASLGHRLGRYLFGPLALSVAVGLGVAITLA